MIKVYASGATRSRRVLWALEELGGAYEVVPLKFPPRVHHPEFLEINPAGVLPAIQDGDVTLIESLAICMYVNRKLGGDLVVQEEEPGYLDYIQLLHFGEASLAPPLGWARRFGPRLEEVMAEARETFALRLSVVERTLADGREFLAAERLTLADLSVGYALGLSKLSGLYEVVPPSVVHYHGRLQARPAYRRAYAIN
jgi:glutathione S-transferase